METKENVKKLCSFCVSDIHFGTMILPYISKKIEQRNNIYTIFEKDMYNNIEKVISNLNLNKETKEEIKKVEWDKKTQTKDIRNYIRNLKQNSGIVLVRGNKKFIDKTNKKIEKQVKRKGLEDVTIINFYNVDVFNQNMGEILKSHNGILNTLGESKIEV